MVIITGYNKQSEISLHYMVKYIYKNRAMLQKYAVVDYSCTVN